MTQENNVKSEYFDFLSPQLYFTYLIYYRMEKQLNYYTIKWWKEAEETTVSIWNQKKKRKAQHELINICEDEKIKENSENLIYFDLVCWKMKLYFQLLKTLMLS